MNLYSSTILIAPMTSSICEYPTRISIHFDGRDGQIALDQLRAVDLGRLVKRLGEIKEKEARVVLGGLANLFAE